MTNALKRSFVNFMNQNLIRIPKSVTLLHKKRLHTIYLLRLEQIIERCLYCVIYSIHEIACKYFILSTAFLVTHYLLCGDVWITSNVTENDFCKLIWEFCFLQTGWSTGGWVWPSSDSSYIMEHKWQYIPNPQKIWTNIYKQTLGQTFSVKI